MLEPLDQLAFARYRDVVLFGVEILEIRFPAAGELFPCLVLSSTEGELKRRIDPLDRLVESLHGDHTAVVFPKNGIDAVTQAQQQHDSRAADGRQQKQQGN